MPCNRAARLLLSCLILGLAACGPAPQPIVTAAPPEAPVAASPAAIANWDRIDRPTFNRAAAERFLPLFWTADKDGDSALDPDELALLWGFGTPGRYLDGAAFGPDFARTYEGLASLATPPVESPDEARRLKAVRRELAQGRPTLLSSDFRQATAEDKAIVHHILAATARVEILHAKQNGVLGFDAQVPVTDTASRMLLYRNQGPWCEAPETEKDPDCNAIAAKPKRISGLYPADIQADPKFCETLAARKDQKELLAPFSVVLVGRDGGLIAQPYHVVYEADMTAVATSLEAAAAAIVSPGEAAFKTYLTAAAKAFRDGSWEAADEAWSRMSVANSKWYLRIGPDETYFEPCSRKAGFHVSFARINQDSVKWQNLLDPLKNELEQALAKLAGPPYKARKVAFHLPDFIDIILNAGDSRSAHGATVGQSLPNWGPVANEGRGRTVAMTNLYTDADSKAQLRVQAASLYCKATLDLLPPSDGPQVMSTVLHEAAHNLGPAHEYKVKGKTDDEIFGGPMAAMLEELKSQTAALYFADWLVAKGTLTSRQRDEAHVADLSWAFGHIAQGMYNPEGKPKAYSQLAAIQAGSLLAAGALQWRKDEKAANGTDTGCFEVMPDKLPATIEALMTKVARIKGAGDAKGALALRAELVDADGPWKTLRDTIRERWLRAPKATFVYAIAVD